MNRTKNPTMSLIFLLFLAWPRFHPVALTFMISLFPIWVSMNEHVDSSSLLLHCLLRDRNNLNTLVFGAIHDLPRRDSSCDNPFNPSYNQRRKTSLAWRHCNISTFYRYGVEYRIRPNKSFAGLDLRCIFGASSSKSCSAKSCNLGMNITVILEIQRSVCCRTDHLIATISQDTGHASLSEGRVSGN